jgi:glyoxylase-like metal-dependent hydrolase (beta-lactamase superfamily II)
MLKSVADDVLVHESEFIQSNSTVARGREGVLLVDPGITESELEHIADDVRELGHPVEAGYSTHPHWDHVLWHEGFGDVPRYATELAAATMREVLSGDDWRARVAEGLPPEHAREIPMELFGRIVGLPAGTTRIPWHGPSVRLIEHRAHAAGHAALFVEQSGVLVAGDMLSDILIPFLDLQAADPLGDYLEALELFESVASGVDVVIPGHGSVGGRDDVRARIALDREYVLALRDGRDPDDPRVGPSAPLYWLADVHDWQVRQLARR